LCGAASGPPRPERAVRSELHRRLRSGDRAARRLFRARRQPGELGRQPDLGGVARAHRERHGVRAVLAAESIRPPLSMAWLRSRSTVQLALTVLLALVLAYGVQRYLVCVLRVPRDSMARNHT